MSNLSRIISLVNKADDNLQPQDHDKILTEGALSNYLTTNATENSQEWRYGAKSRDLRSDKYNKSKAYKIDTQEEEDLPRPPSTQKTAYDQVSDYYKLQERLEEEEKQVLFDRKLDRIGQNLYE